MYGQNMMVLEKHRQRLTCFKKGMGVILLYLMYMRTTCKEAELGLLPPTLAVTQVKPIWVADFRFIK